MAKHKKRSSACTASAHVKKRKVTVKATCPLKGKVVSVKTTKRKVKHHKRVELPAACKGMKHGTKRNKCVRDVCAQRPTEYRSACMKKAGLKKV